MIYNKMISHKDKFVFIHIPKTGGTSIESALGGNIRNIHRGPNRHKHGTPRQSRYPKVWNTDYFKFAFVRNPWDRIVSAYFYELSLSLKRHSKRRSPNKKRRNLIGRLGEGGFNKFIQEHLYQNKKIINRAVWYTPQYHWIRDHNYDFIGRFESLQADFNKVCTALSREPKELKHFRGGTSGLVEKSERRTEYKKYYDDKSTEIISELYDKDIETFNYSF